MFLNACQVSTRFKSISPMTVLVKSLQVNCRYAERDIRVCPKTDVIPMLTVAHASRLFTRAEEYDHARSSNHDRDNQYPRCGSMQIDGRCARCKEAHWPQGQYPSRGNLP